MEEFRNLLSNKTTQERCSQVHLSCFKKTHIMKRQLLTIISFVAITVATNAQNVTIPDANFKAYLVGNISINTNADTEIQVSEAQAYSGGINCSGFSIANLGGIESFISLIELNCSNNQLTTLDVSSNTLLTNLNFGSNQISTVNLSSNALISYLYCDNNLLETIDVSALSDLVYLSMYSNNLVSIDLTQNSFLTHLWCMFNPLEALDLSQNLNFIMLQANNCELTFVNLANGNNANFIAAVVNNNTNLTCIKVDNASYSVTNWTSNDFNKDANASYSENCIGTAGIEQNNEMSLLSSYPNPVSEILTIESQSLSSLKILSSEGKTVATLSGASNYNFDASILENGMYFIQAENGATLKFIKN